MGCTGSKLDDIPAVALCRDHCAFLNQAIQKHYDLAGAHVAYVHSLKDLGRFFDQDLANSLPSPVLNLPPKRKGYSEPSTLAAPAPAINHSHSHSGSHPQFNSEDDDDDNSLHLHSDDTTPVHPLEMRKMSEKDKNALGFSIYLQIEEKSEERARKK
ncbi:hypothetical protein LguiA_015798 [Lonicera macranthoides]